MIYIVAVNTMDNENNTIEKDAALLNLERMLEKMPEKSRQPIIDLINKRKVELGLMKSELKPMGYKLRTNKRKPKPPLSKEKKEEIQKIAAGVGRVAGTKQVISNIDMKDEPLKKDKKAIEEADSYKY